jgi:SAM-dependent methyltransferase
MSEADDELRAGLQKLRAYWDGRARSRLPDLEKLEWSHWRTQRLRFDAFLADHDLQGKSVLDLGCGLGHFYAHLRRRGIAVEYLGYDLSPAMIQQCRARFPDQRFESGDFLSYQPASRFDYSVAFGIHNIRVPGARAILEQVTRHQFALSSVAAHVSLLSDRYTAFAPHLQAWPAGEVLALALTITPYVALHRDYLETDCSITLYRATITKSRLSGGPAYDYE